jgi:pimeloyl-ACP methyl ester carboxylesterase
VEFGVLGPLKVTAGGRPLGLAGARTRAVLAMLIVHANQVVSSDRLTEELWPGQLRAGDSLQVRLSGLRKALRLAGEADRLVTRRPGYLLRLNPDELDARRFERLAVEGNAALAGGDAAAAVRLLDEALRLWRGPALAGLDDAPSMRAEAARLEEERLAALESRAEALLGCGRHRDVIAELGPELRELHGRILRQDPALGAARSQPDQARGPDAPTARRTRYAPTQDGIHVAYHVLGTGEPDIIFVPGLMSHLELLWEDQEASGFFRRLSGLGRLIVFDKRDTGLSDPAPADMSLEERTEDVRAVMRAAGSSRAVLFGYSEGAPMSLLFAATYPERVAALILGSASARWFPADGYPCGAESRTMFDGPQALGPAPSRPADPERPGQPAGHLRCSRPGHPLRESPPGPRGGARRPAQRRDPHRRGRPGGGRHLRDYRADQRQAGDARAASGDPGVADGQGPGYRIRNLFHRTRQRQTERRG